MARVIQAKRMKKRFSKSRKIRGSRAVGPYKPYESIRGTNPMHHAVFRGYGFPDRLTTNVVYTDSIVLTPSVGTPTPSFVLQMTSPYDPQYSTGGGQPTYWDQLSTIYSRYVVNGAKLTATFSRGSLTTADVGPYICGIECSDSTSLPTSTAGTLIATPNTSWKLVNENSGADSVVATYSRANVFPDFADGVQARMTSNPSVNWYAKVFASPQGTNVTTPINCVFVLEFNVTLSDVLSVVDA